MELEADTAAIQAMAAKLEGRARLRCFRGEADVRRLYRALEGAKKTARVYCGPFVPNCYRGNAKVTRLTATPAADGGWVVVVERAPANRSFGHGARTVVDGRGVS